MRKQLESRNKNRNSARRQDPASILVNRSDDLPNVILGILGQQILPRGSIGKSRLGPLHLPFPIQLLLLLLREERPLDLGLDLFNEGLLGLFLLEFVGEAVENGSMNALLFDDFPSLAPVLAVKSHEKKKGSASRSDRCSPSSRRRTS